MSADEDIFLTCKLCNFAFTDVEPFEQHMKGKKHQKKVKEKELKEKIREKDEDITTATNIDSDSNSDSDNDDKEELMCRLCAKKFSGYIPFNQHSKSSCHTKNIRRQRLVLKLASKSNRADVGIEDENPLYLLVNKPFATCKLCAKDFSGPESYKNHLQSRGHKKKTVELKVLECLKKKGKLDFNFLKESIESSSNSSESEETASPDIDSYESQLIKYLENKIYSCNLEELLTDDEDLEKVVLECEDCIKTFSGIIPFVQHLFSRFHEKKVKQNKLLKEMKDLQEDDDATEDNRIKERPSNIPGILIQDGILVCKTCNAAFSGVESAQAHVKGKKHNKMIKKKSFIEKYTKASKDGDENLKVIKDSNNKSIYASGSEFQACGGNNTSEVTHEDEPSCSTREDSCGEDKSVGHIDEGNMKDVRGASSAEEVVSDFQNETSMKDEEEEANENNSKLLNEAASSKGETKSKSSFSKIKAAVKEILLDN